jgi:hypothetical protein
MSFPKAEKPKSVGQEFLSSQRFRNDLPMLQIGPKLLQVLRGDRHSKYSYTSLHNNAQYPIATIDNENGLGVSILK